MSAEASVIRIVDDDPSVRESLRRLASSLGHAARAYGSADEFLGSLRPDARGCVILDVELPDLNGLQVQARLLELGLLLPIIFLTGQGDIPMSVRAMKAGAIEFLTKPFLMDQLVGAIRSALELDGAAQKERLEVATLRRRYEALSTRERQVMAGVIKGLLNKQVAAELGTAEATVKKQRGQVMVKMGAGSLAELVGFGARLGISTAIPPK
jgi:FixJ family two-component response regulator